MNIYDSTLTSKGQTTIPVEVREALDLKPGDKIRYIVNGGKVYLRVKNKRAIDLAGKFYDPNRAPITVEEMNRGIGDAIADHVMGVR
jgi:AbrB family looped-hinge helix DNA binding protein